MNNHHSHQEFLETVKSLVLSSTSENNQEKYSELVKLVKAHSKRFDVSNKEMVKLLMPLSDIELDDYQHDVLGDVILGLEGMTSPKIS